MVKLGVSVRRDTAYRGKGALSRRTTSRSKRNLTLVILDKSGQRGLRTLKSHTFRSRRKADIQIAE